MAAKKKSALDAILPRLKTTDISPLVRVASVMVPPIMNGFFRSLDEKQKKAMDKAMPPGGGKKLYLQLTGTPTPPIVVEISQPLKLATMPEKEVRQQKMKGIRMAVEDIQLLAGGRKLGNVLRLCWRLKGQVFTILGIMWMFRPLLLLGPSGLKDMGRKLKSRWKPLLDLFS